MTWRRKLSERQVDAAILGGQASLNLLPPSLRVVGKMFVCGSTILRNPLLDAAAETATKPTNQTNLSGHCPTNFIARAVIANFIARTVIANFIAAVASRR